MSSYCISVCFSSWSNLEDLQLWLSVREVQYQFKEVEEFRGATYTGKWELGKQQGMSVLSLFKNFC